MKQNPILDNIEAEKIRRRTIKAQIPLALSRELC